MNFKQQLFAVLSLLALTQVIKADFEGSTFEIASPKNPTICRSHFNGTILAHTTDCQKFYMCVNYKPQEYNCDPNFHFDPTTLTCEAGAACSTTVMPPSTCVDGTINSVEDDCYVFEICVKGQYQKLNCPANSYFHAPQGICVPLKFNAQFKCSCVLPEHTVLDNVNNCETYFMCQGKTAVLTNCPLGQYYNSSVNACIADLEGICLMTPTKTPDQVLQEAEAKTLCAEMGAQNLQFQTFAQACNKFYICLNGNLHTQTCPQGFYYDSEKKYCLVDVENKCNVADAQQVKEVQKQDEKVLKETVKLSQSQDNLPVNNIPTYHKPTLVLQDKLFSKFIKF